MKSVHAESLFGQFGQEACDLMIELVGHHPILYTTVTSHLQSAHHWNVLGPKFAQAFLDVVREMRKRYAVDAATVWGAWKSIRVNYFTMHGALKVEALKRRHEERRQERLSMGKLFTVGSYLLKTF
ncbi:hypothetical protein QR680_019331 [Steinernema hermaphroditum]|uniref:Uncharacterized protein n=1 Tax=Steinernema hermaphroditum TaxID=289476 RepID=A0AA39GNB3_9BILA|nr:hypothetical protein QR680_019331 [Steinernema hermaphroditum]